MKDNLIIQWMNAPKDHQAIITRLIHGLAEMYLKDRTSLFPYPETMIDEGQTSQLLIFCCTIISLKKHF